MIRVVNKTESQVVVTGQNTFTHFSDFIVLGSVVDKKLFFGYISPYHPGKGIVDEQFCSFYIEKSIEDSDMIIEMHNKALDALKALNPGLNFEYYNLYLQNGES